MQYTIHNRMRVKEITNPETLSEVQKHTRTDDYKNFTIARMYPLLYLLEIRKTMKFWQFSIHLLAVPLKIFIEICHEVYRVLIGWK
jgi:hypothetical protein